jgi:CO/xanthine dehydrogenase FAD-binding subunit
VLAPDELITAVRIAPAAAAQQFAKIGTRNAMVIAVCSFAVSLWPAGRPGGGGEQSGGGRVGTGIGSAGPVPLRATEAERFLDGELDAAGLWTSRGALPAALGSRFGELVAGAAKPIDDVRGAAAYRRHALAVLARRTLGWAWDAYRKEAATCG